MKTLPSRGAWYWPGPTAQPAPTAEGGAMATLLSGIRTLKRLNVANADVATILPLLEQAAADHAAEVERLKAHEYQAQERGHEIEHWKRASGFADAESFDLYMGRMDLKAHTRVWTERIAQISRERDEARARAIAAEKAEHETRVAHSLCANTLPGYARQKEMIDRMDSALSEVREDLAKARAKVELLTKLRAEWEAAFSGRADFPDQEFSPENLRTVIREQQERDEARAEVALLLDACRLAQTTLGEQGFGSWELAGELTITIRAVEGGTAAKYLAAVRASQSAPPAANLGELRAKLEKACIEHIQRTTDRDRDQKFIDAILALLPAHDDRKTEAGR